MRMVMTGLFPACEAFLDAASKSWIWRQMTNRSFTLCEFPAMNTPSQVQILMSPVANSIEPQQIVLFCYTHTVKQHPIFHAEAGPRGNYSSLATAHKLLLVAYVILCKCCLPI
jgi:hypothetical protein